MTENEILARVKTGDVLGFSGAHWTSDFINVVTFGVPRWSISHVGIVCEVGGRKLLFEALMDAPSECAITGELTKGAQAHDIGEVLGRYKGRVWHYPLYRPMYRHEEQRLKFGLIAACGTPYDQLGAFRSGGFMFGMLQGIVRRESKNTLFCSEWLMYSIGETGIYATGNASRWNPNKSVRRLRLAGILESPYRMV